MEVHNHSRISVLLAAVDCGGGGNSRISVLLVAVDCGGGELSYQCPLGCCRLWGGTLVSVSSWLL